MNIKARAKRLKADIPAVFIAMKDKDTPWKAKIAAALTVGYALSPVDLIPDFIPVLGYLDDLIILPSMAALTIRWIPDEVWVRSRAKAEGMWQDDKPKKWYYALPVLFVWGIVIWMIVKSIWL